MPSDYPPTQTRPPTAHAHVTLTYTLNHACRENDLEVNPVRPKKLTNVRNSGSEERVVLTPPRTLGLEDALG